MSQAIGIDLGTTFTCVAYMKTDEQVEIAENLNGNKITPSVVHFGAGGMPKVGEDAVVMRGKDPKNTVYQVKRFMGRDADDVEIKKRTYPFEIIASDKGNARIRVTPAKDGKNGDPIVLCPEQISSDIVRYAKKIAEESLGQKVTEAVITVPANFTNAQRQATRDAGQLAGLKVLRIINEPTAAALAYGFEKKNRNQTRTVLVYDLGGGTFDVSIVSMRGTEADVKSTQGRTFLGGEDFDNRLYEEALSQFRNMGFDLPAGGEFALLQSCEEAKRTLSTCPSAEIETFTADGERKSFVVNRETFEELCQDLFEKTIDCVKDAITESEFAMSEIDDVVLVGGSSRIPKVQEMLQNLFTDKKLKFDIPPDHAVAHGAAILASSLSESDNLPTLRSTSRGAVKLADRTPFSLGTRMIFDLMDVIIPKNTTYPTSRSEVYGNTSDGQEKMRFEIREGQKALASQNNLLGKMIIDVPPRPRGESKMKTTFSVDADGILVMQVVDVKTGKESKITVQSSQLSPEEMADMERDASRLEQEETVQQAKLTARNAFVDALNSAKRALRRVADSSKMEEIRQIVEREEEWIHEKDPSNNVLYDHAKEIREALRKITI